MPATSDEFGLQVKIGTSETVNFSAPQTAGAVYVGQTVGNPDPGPWFHDNVDHDVDFNGRSATTAATTAQLKFQTDTTNVDAPPQIPGQANFVAGPGLRRQPRYRAWAPCTPTQVGSDGSVYVLADVTDATDGQALQGTQDVALMKYDSAGNLVYTRTLGASDSASGLGLAVSSTGQVAVVGSVTGGLNGATAGRAEFGRDRRATPTDTDSFVTLYDTSGNEVWTQSRGSQQNDQATQVAFSADGSTVYVAGQAQGALPGGGAPIGGYDGYIEGFTTTAKGTPQATFTQTFGTAGADKPQGLVVNGDSLITASVEDGHAVLRNFDISSGTPVLSSTRDLGDLQGGSISGLALNNGQLVVAGTTTNTALSAGTITRAASGGTDAFAAQVSADLSSQPSDAIAYYGGTGNDRATSLAVSNGQVWIGGQAGTSTCPASLPRDQGRLPRPARHRRRARSSIQSSGSPARTAWPPRRPSLSIRPEPACWIASACRRATSEWTPPSSSPLKARCGPASSSPSGAAGSGRADDHHHRRRRDAQHPGGEDPARQRRAGHRDGHLGRRPVAARRITPAYAASTVTFGAGPDRQERARRTLGLPEGVLSQTITANGTTSPADGGKTIYALGLASTLNIDNAAQISHAKAVVAAAQGVIRRAYQDLVTAATPQNAGAEGAAAAAADQRNRCRNT